MDVLFEDKYLIIINKNQGLMVEPDGHGHPNLCDSVREHLAKTSLKKEIFLQPVHRLDRPVSGVVLFALKPAALKHLNAQFADRAVAKHYFALTEQQPPASKGSLRHFLFKDPANKKAMISDTEKPGSQAVHLNYEIIASSGGIYLWKIQLQTGKYHQIRAQLAHIGCPIIGDIKYGSACPYKADAIALHACELTFFHPVSHVRMTIQAPVPDDELWSLFSF